MDLPTSTCPNVSVATITLHPSYLAKTFFPLGLFRAVHVEPVGSKPRKIRPEKGAKKPTKEDLHPTSPTIDVLSLVVERLFNAGQRK